MHTSCRTAQTGISSALRRLTASALCVLLTGNPALASTPPHRAAAVAQLAGTERTLFALDRLTFGPRPGDLAAVGRMGLANWFEQQLNPASIDDSALEARLSRFPATNLAQPALYEQFPSPQRIRQLIATGDPLPSDPTLHAIYADHIAFYEAAKARKEATAATTSQAAGMTSQAPATTPKPAPSTANPATADIDATDPDLREEGRARHAAALFPQAETDSLLALPPSLRLEKILAMSPTDLVHFRQSLSRGEMLSMQAGLSPQQVELLTALRGSGRMIGNEVLQSRLERDVYTRRQVEAVMTDFWLNHFNVYLRKNQNEPYLLPAYERETVRPRALGRFEDLLVATAQSPAMLVYLDNAQSVGPDSLAAQRSARRASLFDGKKAPKERGLNENYARELMELHTLGVGCEVSKDHPASALDPGCGTGYTQADVTEVAKVFSGWTITGPAEGGTFHFDPRRHQPGAKTVLGHRIAEGGESEGLEVLHLLATSPATAHFICTKLAVRLVSDTPPPSLVAEMTETFLASNGDLKAVLRTMFGAGEFWSPSLVDAKVKTPLEFVVSALRASDAEITDARPLLQALTTLGMPLYGMQTPNGYNWSAEPWVSTGALVARMNFAVALSNNRLRGTRVDWNSLAAPQASPTLHPVSLTASPSSGNVSREEARLELLLLGRPASPRTRAAVLAQLTEGHTEVSDRGGESPHTSNPTAAQATLASSQLGPQAGADDVAVMGGLLLGSPEFQRR